jgi:hypothetical protein
MFKLAASIAVTYADKKGYGDGHKVPAQSIAKLMQSLPEYKDSDIDFYPETNDGIKGIKNKTYDIVVNTGHGAVKGPKKESPLKYRYLVNYNPDVPFHGNNLNLAVGHDKSVNLIFGKDTTATLPNSKYLGDISPIINTEPFATPINKEQIAWDLLEDAKTSFPKIKGNEPELQGLSDADLKRLVAQRKLDRQVAASQVGSARKLKNYKRLVAISGSGMGTYVSQRADELSKALKEQGMNDVGVVALRARGEKDPKALADVVRGRDNVVMFEGRIPQKSFMNLQRAADIHWGSSGASSFQEALLAENVFALPKRWGAGLVVHDMSNDTLAGRMHNNLKGKTSIFNRFNPLGYYHAQDVFNSGQLETFKNYDGTYRADSGDDIVKLLKDENKLTDLTNAAKVRSAKLLQDVAINREELGKYFSDILREADNKNTRRKKRGWYV